jgi:hypothetical protein
MPGRTAQGKADDLGGLHRLQVQFLIHHGGQPSVPVGGDGVDHAVQQAAREALGRIDVTDPGPLGLGNCVDLGLLPGLFGQVVVAFGDRGIADR